MITLQEARTLVQPYAKQAGAIRFDNPIADRGTYWFFPVGYIGSRGVIIDKATGRLHVLGSALSLEECFWAHEHGFSPGLVVLRVLRVHDRPSTIELLLHLIDEGPPRRRNPNPRRAWLEKILDVTPYEFAPQYLWLAAPAFRDAAEQGWFEYQIAEAAPGDTSPPATDEVR